MTPIAAWLLVLATVLLGEVLGAVIARVEERRERGASLGLKLDGPHRARRRR